MAKSGWFKPERARVAHYFRVLPYSSLYQSLCRDYDEAIDPEHLTPVVSGVEPKGCKRCEKRLEAGD